MISKLSVLIPSYNSEKYIRATLESVKWADEILVCDSYSTDKTLAIAREYGAKIIQHEYINSANQKNWAIPQCSCEWIFQIDTDEVMEPGLREEIEEILINNDPAVNGYEVSGKNYVYGRWLKHGGFYPDWHMRLFRRDKARYEPREVHARMEVEGRIGRLSHHLLHNGFKDLSTWLTKIERYTSYETKQLLKEGKRFRWRKVTLYPLIIFIRGYFLKLGILDGYPGFLMAVLDAFYYLSMHIKLFEKYFFRLR